MSFETQLNTGQLLGRIYGNQHKVQFMLVNQIISDTRPFVPFLSGNLANTVTANINGSSIIYNAPYARKLYYHPEFKFSKQHHPLATGVFFEVAKGIHLSQWLSQTQKGLIN
ncbi:minor capsid protein [Listeria fleischmannii]|uniref:1-phosphatidylinositol phosphodiesterase n=1 Tax=Listeria fleischmannii FSL S10-1203 TaxID=1265822 RepID=W7DJT0_9LIST|nr:minor capsid protein [Listeria fleischmannii]EUJ47654.1 1-phosphatidylinositol phosphodiesterase [Listeria fleischmannii FSL S10-1203]